MFDLFATAGVNLILGLIKQHKLNEWARLFISCHFSGFCTFTSAWGAGGIAHMTAGAAWPIALAFGFCEGMVAMSAVVFFTFIHNPLSKGIMVSVPGSVVAEETRIMQNQTIVTQGK